MEGRKVNVLIDHGGVVRRPFFLRVSARDASLYLHPASKSGTYRYGIATFPAGSVSHTFDPSNGYEADRPLHVSLKESGRVHIRPRGGGPTAGPIIRPPLASLRGDHVATITATRIDTFKPYERDLAITRGALDQVITGDPEVLSARLALYVNGAEPKFNADRIAFTVTVNSRTLARPLYIGLSPWGQAELGDDASVVVIAGFELVSDVTREQSFLFLKGI